MRRDEFLQILQREQEKITELFTVKNQSYGDTHQVFYNFQETANRIYNDPSHDAMWKVIQIYMDKHLIALTKGINEREFTDRLRDIIVYCLMGIALHEEWTSYKAETEKMMAKINLSA